MPESSTDATSTITLKITTPINPDVIPFKPTNPMESTSSVEILSDATPVGAQSSTSEMLTGTGQ